MSPFKVSGATWLKVEADRIEGIILMPKFWGKAWDPDTLKAALKDIGLEYTDREIAALNDELHRRGVVEDVS